MAVPSSPRAVNAAVFAGCMIAFLSFGFSFTFGVFLAPMSADLGWGREVFSLSVAIQLIVLGITQPIAGAIADRYGTGRVLFFGAIATGAGFALRGVTTDPTLFILTGLIVGAGMGSANFAIVIGALGKIVSAQHRSFIMGLGTASASAGMFIGAPVAVQLIQSNGWDITLFIIGASFLLILPFIYTITRVSKPTVDGSSGNNFGFAISTAFKDRNYLLLFIGFYVCGFHVSFISTHMPAFVVDLGLASWVGAWSLSLIGLFNIAGSFASGWSGQIFSKKKVLAGIYFARAVVITAFILFPITANSVLIFSAAMGLLWLSTIPLTMGLVAQTQGLKFLATLSGFVFLSHQIGSFTGAWLGGRLYDVTGDYTAMWWAAVILGLLAALIHLPIREEPGPLARLETSPNR